MIGFYFIAVWLVIFVSPILNFYYGFELWFIVPIFSTMIFSLRVYLYRFGVGWIFALLLIFLSVCSMIISFSVDVFYRGGVWILGIVTFSFIVLEISRQREYVIYSAYEFICFLVVFYAFYQYLSQLYGFPFWDREIYRGRTDLHGNYQVTSFFAEPAFLGVFITIAVYFQLFLKNKVNYYLLICLLLCAFFSRSASSLLSISLLMVLYLFIYFQFKYFFFVVVGIVPVTFLYAYSVVGKVLERLNDEVFSGFHDIFNYEVISKTSSGSIRVLGEFKYFIYTLVNSPFIGFGIDYNYYLSNEGIERTMALNSIVEIFVRFGFVGLILIFSFFYYEKRNYPPKSYFAFFLLLFLVSFSDGAIAKPQYYIPLAMIFGLERSRVLNMVKK